MYNILVVDDEPLAQVGIKSMLQRFFACEVQEIRVAANGKEALSILEEQPADIVIADIKMPVMDGLELLQESRRRFGDLPVFIMLTAYEDFEMARLALKEQAIDYIVKIELNRQTLESALTKAFKVVDQVRKNRSGTDVPVSSSRQNFQQQFLLRLFNRQISDREAAVRRARELGISLDYDRYIVAFGEILPMVSGSQGGVSDDYLTLYTSCINMTLEIIRRTVYAQSISIDISHLALLFSFTSARSVADTLSEIESALSTAHDMIHNYFSASINFGIGTAVNDCMNIPDSFDEARKACSQADDLQPVLRYSRLAESNRNAGKDRLIKDVQDYIDSHIADKLTLSEVAEQFGLSASYFSVLFKQQTGVGFSDYVTTQRIEKAKQLLLSGDVKIYEAAEALGFESAFYFSKVFKKKEGCSPKEFIQSKTES
ncbi:MAG: AraC family transcriptional regulator [Lachnospiraceae bacterium]|jgi:two-component system response regulator YesN|nr:AraC family transcriptional regulator [Lachnospiraceae bacterium]MCH4070970.1 AraC family transcriptional regulator [Lachnospiraceae bacterium]MCH4107957.1 AraC family transcriptional regulator [Lachnospiraceae bacterium]MCI1302424.1 AraC family transcriptional regulator [Lachnospiraceae bacterium]MCI1332602.1 AraC family transcriptional regulator [Lachnospiraceae bacterium]